MAEIRNTRAVLHRLKRVAADKGLAFPADDSNHRSAKQTALNLEQAKESWSAGNLDRLPDVAIPARTLSVAEISELANLVDFVLRRSNDGYHGSRRPAIVALELGLRIDRAIAALLSSGEGVDLPDVRQALFILVGLQFYTSRTLIFHLTDRHVPDLADPDNPDAFMDWEATRAFRVELLRRLVGAHDLMSLAASSMDSDSALIGQAEMDGQRIMAHSTVESTTLKADGAADLRPSGTRLEQMVSRFESVLKADSPEAGEIRVSCTFGRSIATRQWAGDEEGFLEDLEGLADDASLPASDRASWMLSALGLTTSPENTLARVHRILELIVDQPSPERLRLLARSGFFLANALTSTAHALKSETSMVAALIAGFDLDWYYSEDRGTQVWLLFGPSPLAIIDRRESTDVIDLPELGNDGSLEILVKQFAEEHEKAHSVVELRKLLSRQLRPLGAALAEEKQVVWFHGFGHLKHIPLGSLTASGSVLAVKPGVRQSVRRRLEPAESSGKSRRWILDRSFTQTAKIAKLQDAADKQLFDSSAESEEDIASLVDLFDAIDNSVGELLFFGHGYVDQFDHQKSGLVSRGGESGSYFLPASEIAVRDYSHLSLVVLMACGAGQANVFIDAGLSAAAAFCAAGVRYVIAPIWPIQSQDAYEFVRRFDLRREDGMSVGDAWSATLAEDPSRFCSITLFGAA